MALYDWNHDSSYTSSNGISTFGAILSTVGVL